MRVECEACRELVVANLAIDGDTVRATCPSCNAVTTTTTTGAPAIEPALLCPKCGASRKADAKACPTCGIAVERMAAFEAARDANVPEVLLAAWTSVTEAWDDAARHDELMRLVAANDCYAWAAGRYRTRRDAVAQRQLDRIRRAAEATMLASATVRDRGTPKPYRATLAILAMMIIVIAAGLFYALVIRHDAPDAAAKPTPALRVR